MQDVQGSRFLDYRVRACGRRGATVHRERWKSVLRGLVLLGFLAVVVLGCSEDPEVKKQRHFSRGEEYLSKHNFDEAIIEFRNAIQVAPRFAEAHNRLGRAYQRKSWMFDA